VNEAINRLINKIISLFMVGHACEQPGSVQNMLLDNIKEAHREWQIALNNFDHCSDNDMIDYAVYNVNAAEKRYIFLMKKARQEKLSVDIPFGDTEKTN
jgi:hypothetical protein